MHSVVGKRVQHLWDVARGWQRHAAAELRQPEPRWPLRPLLSVPTSVSPLAVSCGPAVGPAAGSRATSPAFAPCVGVGGRLPRPRRRR